MICDADDELLRRARARIRRYGNHPIPVVRRNAHGIKVDGIEAGITGGGNKIIDGIVTIDDVLIDECIIAIQSVVAAIAIERVITLIAMDGIIFTVTINPAIATTIRNGVIFLATRDGVFILIAGEDERCGGGGGGVGVNAANLDSALQGLDIRIVRRGHGNRKLVVPVQTNNKLRHGAFRYRRDGKKTHPAVCRNAQGIEQIVEVDDIFRDCEIGDCVVPFQDRRSIGAGRGIDEGIRSGASRKTIVGGAAEQRVIPVPTLKGIIAGAAKQNIVACSATERVIPRLLKRISLPVLPSEVSLP